MLWENILNLAQRENYSVRKTYEVMKLFISLLIHVLTVTRAEDTSLFLASCVTITTKQSIRTILNCYKFELYIINYLQ